MNSFVFDKGETGVAGPIAVFVTLLPFMIAGILLSDITTIPNDPGTLILGEPFLFKALARFIHGPLPEGAPVAGEDKVIEALRTVHDPEIPVNIYDLGLIYRIGLSDDGETVAIDMTLTAPGCPVAGSMPSMVEHSVRGMAHAKEVTVNLVWDPPWDKDMMSEAARLELGFF